MKLSTKPISSPGRTEKFPPPLMRFLRSNAGSRSRGRCRSSRSSPMFIRKKSTAIETQEPSSPKVTCMGQIQVRRSSTKPGRNRRTGAASAAPPPQRRRRRCKWIRNALFCHRLSGGIEPKSCGPVWRKWVLFFQVGFRRKPEIKQESPQIASKFGYSEEEEEEEDEGEENEREAAKVFVSPCSSSLPPKNALLLTRCRSAPYRSSSLASRFWGSPLMSEETEEEEQRRDMVNGRVNENKSTSETESILDREAIAIVGSNVQEKLGLFKQLEDSIRQTIVVAKSEKSEDANEEEEEEEESKTEPARPLILTRCKSEPARIAAKKLDPESRFPETKRVGCR